MDCAVCLEGIDARLSQTLCCGHSFHVRCIGTVAATRDVAVTTVPCPLCRAVHDASTVVTDGNSRAYESVRSTGDVGAACDVLEVAIQSNMVLLRRIGEDRRHLSRMLPGVLTRARRVAWEAVTGMEPHEDAQMVRHADSRRFGRGTMNVPLMHKAPAQALDLSAMQDERAKFVRVGKSAIALMESDKKLTLVERRAALKKVKKHLVKLRSL